MNDAIKSCERVFRKYNNHCLNPDEDSLYDLLNVIHGTSDKLKKHDISLFDIDEFLALKSLRNLFHHETELLNEIRCIYKKDLGPLVTDLAYLCLISRELYEKALQGIARRRREEETPKINSVMKFYGDVVNINPCIFNFIVKFYELLKAHNVQISSPEYYDLEQSYEMESNMGYSHYVTGNIQSTAGNVTKVLKELFYNIPNN